MQGITARQYYKGQIVNAMLQKKTGYNMDELSDYASELADRLLEEDGAAERKTRQTEYEWLAGNE